MFSTFWGIFFIFPQTPDTIYLKELYTKTSQRTDTAICKTPSVGTSPNKKQKNKSDIDGLFPLHKTSAFPTQSEQDKTKQDYVSHYKL